MNCFKKPVLRTAIKILLLISISMFSFASATKAADDNKKNLLNEYAINKNAEQLLICYRGKGDNG